MADEKRRSVRQRLATIIIAGVGSALASVISYATAIYEAANPKPLRVFTAGETIDTGRWNITVSNARLSTSSPTGLKPITPKKFLMVDFDAANRSAASAFVPMKLLALDPPVAGLADPTIYLARDRFVAGAVHPGLPEKLTLVWEVPIDATLPDKIRLSVGSQIYKKRDNLYGASNWLDRDPVAAVELKIADAASGDSE
jgi:hypothetical protein